MPITPLLVDHVQLAAPPGCEAAARAFFIDLLGFEELPKQGETAQSGGAWFRAANIEIHVGVQQDFAPATKAHVALRCADEAALRALSEQLAGAGYPIRWDERLPGVARFFTTDPWGNRVELMARL